MKPLFSIITPTYNRVGFLENTISSVFHQSYPSWELVVIDDGSTDKTKELVGGFKDKRIRYVYQSHQGPSAARNKGLESARGDWIAYIDSDNELFSNYLETMYSWITRYSHVLYALPKGNRTLELYRNNTLVEIVDDSSDFPDTLSSKDIALRKIHFDINGFVHSRKIIEDNIRFDEAMNTMEDWDLALFICEKYPERFLYIPVKLFHYHQRFGTDGLVSGAGYAKWAESFEKIYQKHKNDAILKGQTWYPYRVHKYRELEELYRQGKAPPSYLKYFTNHHLGKIAIEN